jgi:hypothetical protein
MREAKSYTDPYHRKKTQAFFGPYERPRTETFADYLLAIILGLAFAFTLFYGLSS